MPLILFLHGSEQKTLSSILAVVHVIRVGLVIKGYNTQLNINFGQCSPSALHSVVHLYCNYHIYKQCYV